MFVLRLAFLRSVLALFVVLPLSSSAEIANQKGSTKTQTVIRHQKGGIFHYGAYLADGPAGKWSVVQVSATRFEFLSGEGESIGYVEKAVSSSLISLYSDSGELIATFSSLKDPKTSSSYLSYRNAEGEEESRGFLDQSRGRFIYRFRSVSSEENDVELLSLESMVGPSSDYFQLKVLVPNRLDEKLIIARAAFDVLSMERKKLLAGSVIAAGTLGITAKVLHHSGVLQLRTPAPSSLSTSSSSSANLSSKASEKKQSGKGSEPIPSAGFEGEGHHVSLPEGIDSEVLREFKVHKKALLSQGKKFQEARKAFLAFRGHSPEFDRLKNESFSQKVKLMQLEEARTDYYAGKMKDANSSDIQVPLELRILEQMYSDIEIGKRTSLENDVSPKTLKDHSGKIISFEEADDASFDQFQTSQMPFGHSSTLGRRDSFEDAYLVHKGTTNNQTYSLSAVFDGHGGSLVAKTAVRALPLVWEAEAKKVDLSDLEQAKQALLETFLKLNDEIKRIIRSDLILESIDSNLSDVDLDISADLLMQYQGSTAVVSVILGDNLLIANLGDARVLAIGLNSQFQRFTADHKVKDPYELARIQFNKGSVKNDRLGGSLAVSRALGDLALVPAGLSHTPEIMVVKEFSKVFGGGGTLVHACDGVFDVLSDSAIDRYVRAQVRLGKSPKEIARGIVAGAYNAGSQDNLSALVVQYPSGQTSN